MLKIKKFKIMDDKDKVAPHFVTSHDFRGDVLRPEKLHQLGAELQSIKNKNPIIVK